MIPAPDEQPAKAEPELDELWRRVQAEIARVLPAPTYQLWIDPVRVAGISGNRLLLNAPAPVRSWVERRYAGRVIAALGRIAPHLSEFAFVDEAEARREDQPDAGPGHTFDAFVLGPSNRLAHAAALRVAEDPGLAYNPMYVWGPPGIGKTHLLSALVNYAVEANPGLRARYATTEEFTEEFVAAVRGPGTAALRERLRQLDLLVIDDAHYLAGRAKTQQELIHAFDMLIARGAQIVIAAEQPPTAIEGLSESLRDRFDSGLSVEMTRPDLTTRIAVITRIVSEGRFPIPDQETLARVAELAPPNFRRLEAALTRVLAHSSLLGRQPSPELADAALGPAAMAEASSQADSQPAIDAIIDAVCRTQHVPAEELRSKRRTPDLVRARRVAMYLARESGLSLSEIGGAFRRDHSTVISALRTVERKLEPGEELHNAVDSARRALHSASA